MNGAHYITQDIKNITSVFHWVTMFLHRYSKTPNVSAGQRTAQNCFAGRDCGIAKENMMVLVMTNRSIIAY